MLFLCGGLSGADGGLRQAEHRLELLHTGWAIFGPAAGITNGNVLLRREQYRLADDLAASCRIAKYMIWGKLFNGRWSIERTKRDHKLRVDEEKIPECIVGDL